MKPAACFLFIFIFVTSCHPLRQTTAVRLPEWMKGQFEDDYGINYTISDTLFTLGSAAKYHILKWNEAGQYLLVHNDRANPTEKGLYTRIDYMSFKAMEPYTWGFCLTVYDGKDTTAALQAPSADRANPRKGCNGFPFSRMKRR